MWENHITFVLLLRCRSQAFPRFFATLSLSPASNPLVRPLCFAVALLPVWTSQVVFSTEALGIGRGFRGRLLDETAEGGMWLSQIARLGGIGVFCGADGDGDD
jgi:hypothetical protein